MEKAHRRYLRFWRFIGLLITGWINRKFHFSYDMSEVDRIDRPVLFIPNHVCDWDPLLVGVANKNRQMYFVMSEHMIRKPVVGKLLTYIFGTILRRKASTDLEVVRGCFNHIKAGHSICLFAEGDQSWDGITGKVFPATGKLAKNSGATLVTFRIEGAFLSKPRWASGVRRGMIRGIAAGIYTPDELNKMSPGEVQRTIERDLYFDIWEWQRSLPEGPVEFKGRRKNKDYAKGMEQLFFLCPECERIGKLKTEGDAIFCDCGFRARFRNTGFLEPVSPVVKHLPYDFTVLSGWHRWQRDELEKRVGQITACGTEEVLFRDGTVKLSQIGRDHKDQLLCEGNLSASFGEDGALMSVGDRSFAMTKIQNMGLILSELILFSYEKEYYQISSQEINIKKYQMLWEILSR